MNKNNHKLRIKVGDTVQVISGANKKDRGEILRIDREKQRAIVSGVNKVFKHVKPTEKEQGKIISFEASIHISNLMVIPKGSEVPSRIGRKHDENAKLRRYAKKTDEFLY